MCTKSVYQITGECQKQYVSETLRLVFFLTINRYNIISDVYFQKQD